MKGSPTMAKNNNKPQTETTTKPLSKKEQAKLAKAAAKAAAEKAQREAEKAERAAKRAMSGLDKEADRKPMTPAKAKEINRKLPVYAELYTVGGVYEVNGEGEEWYLFFLPLETMEPCSKCKSETYSSAPQFLSKHKIAVLALNDAAVLDRRAWMAATKEEDKAKRQHEKLVAKAQEALDNAKTAKDKKEAKKALAALQAA